MNRLREKVIWWSTILLTTILGLLIVYVSYRLVFANSLTKPLPDQQVSVFADYSPDEQQYFFQPLQAGVVDEARDDAALIENQREAFQNRGNPTEDPPEVASATPSPTDGAPTATSSPPPSATSVSPSHTPETSATSTPTSTMTQATTAPTWTATTVWYPTQEPTKAATKTPRPRPTNTQPPPPTRTQPPPPTNTQPPPPTRTQPPPSTNTPRPSNPYPAPTSYP